jgi:hypothetical protein
MFPGKACLRMRQALLASLACVVTGLAFAEPQNSQGPGPDTGAGHETRAASLFRIIPEGFAKNAHGSADLDLRTLAMQPATRVPAPESATAVRRALADLEPAALDAPGTVSAWTPLDERNPWSLIADAGASRQPGAFASPGIASNSLGLARQFSNPVAGIDALDIALIAGREGNDPGFREAANRNSTVQVSLQWTLLGLNWSAGYGLRRANYNESPFPEESARRDRTGMFDLAAEWSLGAGQALRLELNETRNTSSIALYDNRFRQVAIVLRTPL